MSEKVLVHRLKLLAVVLAVLYLYVYAIQTMNEPSAEIYIQEKQEFPVKMRFETNVVSVESLDKEPEVNDETDGFIEFQVPEVFQKSGGSLPVDVQKYMYQLCEEKGVSFELILAMIETESGYRSGVVSSGGAVGYMQIIERWHRDRMARLGVNDLYDPYGNIAVGIDLMSELLKSYTEEQALVAYNAGQKAVMNGVTSSPYSRKIVKRKQELEGMTYAEN